MFTALIWIALFGWNAWSMVDSLNKQWNILACLNAYALGFMSFAILFKVLG